MPYRFRFLSTLLAGLTFGSLLLLLTVKATAQVPSISSFVGVWQGSLPIEQAPRIVVKITSTESGSLRGVFTWIDRDYDPIVFSTLIVEGQEMTALSDLPNVKYGGKLAADRQSFSGTWTQDKRSYPLHLTKVSPGSEWKHDDVAPVGAMSADADPTFEVATIRPAADGTKGRRYEWRTRHFRAYNVTLIDLIKYGFQLRDRQIKNAPTWASDLKFDIAGQPDAPGLPTEQQYHTMMRKLLVERFGLRFHTDQVSFPVYALTQGSQGLKLTRSEPGLGLDGHIAVKQEPEGDTVIRFDSESMPELVGLLMNFIEDRQVVDQTGLTGIFTFSIRVPSTVLQSPDANDKASAFLQAVKPLGLEMVRTNADLPVITLDQAGRPSPN